MIDSGVVSELETLPLLDGLTAFEQRELEATEDQGLLAAGGHHLIGGGVGGHLVQSAVSTNSSRATTADSSFTDEAMAVTARVTARPSSVAPSRTE